MVPGVRDQTWNEQKGIGTQERNRNHSENEDLKNTVSKILKISGWAKEQNRYDRDKSKWTARYSNRKYPA